MRITDRIAKDGRLSWKRKGGVVLAAFLERASTEHTVARLLELTRLAHPDLLNQAPHRAGCSRSSATGGVRFSPRLLAPVTIAAVVFGHGMNPAG